MNDFKRHKIRSGPQRKKISTKAKHNLLAVLVAVAALLFMYTAVSRVIASLSGTRLLGMFTEIVGSRLATDENGHTNVLLLGVGGEGHEGKDLTDTIIIVSLDHRNNHLSLLSIPRDLHIESNLGGSRVNRLYEKGMAKWDKTQGLDFVRTSLATLMEIPMHYVMKVDFEAFSEIVDAMDGIDLFVEETINDNQYPLDGTFDYEPFYLEKGLAHLDGKTALKFVRSRKTSSDFDRSKRQHAALRAMKSKAVSKKLLTNKSFLKNLYYSLQLHIDTDLTIREMLSLAHFGVSWDSNDFGAAILNDEPAFKGGFLYTPLRELYGGAYVLLPAGDSFDSVRSFIKLTLYGPYKQEALMVAVLNATKIPGLASKISAILNRFGIEVIHIGNAQNEHQTTTHFYYASDMATPLATYLSTLIPGPISPLIPEAYSENPRTAPASIILEIGSDAIPKIEKLDIFRNVVPLLSTPSAAPVSAEAPGKITSPLGAAQPK